MSSSGQERAPSNLDRLKWLAVVAMTAGAIYGNHHYSGYPLLYRVLGLVALAGLAVWIVAQTTRGAALWELFKGANMERRRVVWPNRQERNQTTLVVLGFILITAILLWVLDSLFGWLISLIMG